MSYDLSVATQAYATAKALGADGKVMLALFEAGIVESGMRNLSYGDRDSVGFLQQRPSQGWPNPMDVTTATTSFVTRAKAHEKLQPNISAGELAQSVQVSAFPARYDQAETQAASLLTQVSGGAALPANYSTSLTGTSTLDSFTNIGKVITSLSDYHTWLRLGLVTGGIILGYIGFLIIMNQTTAIKDLRAVGINAAKKAILA